MQKTSRAPLVVARSDVEKDIVRPRSSASIPTDVTARPEEVARLAALMERAANAVRQMRYFALAAKRFSFDELVSSAARAGFILRVEHAQLEEASFQWGAGVPDIIFTVSYQDAARVTLVAESQSDLFGLILTAYSQVSIISVETNPTIEESELGENARLFRDMILTFPGFDDVPAWKRYPEITVPEAGGFVEMWRDGVSVASRFTRVWSSISARIISACNMLRRRS